MTEASDWCPHKKKLLQKQFQVVCLLRHCSTQMQNRCLYKLPKINWSSKATQATGGQLELEPLWPLQPSRRGLLTPLVGPDGVELHLSNGLAKLHRPRRTQQASIRAARSVTPYMAYCPPALINSTKSCWWLTACVERKTRFTNKVLLQWCYCNFILCFAHKRK